jgi:hypothetical protein
MATAASYVLNIKDITYVSGTVEMNVQLGNYIAQSSQEVSDVSNELLSDITVPACFAATILSTIIDTGTTIYVPFYGDCFLKSATCTEGFQYAISYMHINALNTHMTKAATLVATGQYSHNGNDWYDSSYQSICHVTDRYGITEFTGGDFWNELTAQFTIPGNINPVAVWTRWKIYSEAGGASVNMHDYTISMEIIPRHTHTWQQVGQAPSTMQAVQVDNTSLIGATPETITCTINGGTSFSIVCASPSFNNSIDILGKATAMGKPLVTGINTIVFTSTTKCSVTPTATYMALPT